MTQSNNGDEGFGPLVCSLAFDQIDSQIAALQSASQKIKDDPASKTGAKGVWIYGPKARKKLDMIAWEINELLIEKKKLGGTYKRADGYSGRQTNRR